MVQAIEGAEDERERATELARHHLVDAKDVLVAVAASGTTPFTLACVREARRRGALTVGIANNADTPLLMSLLTRPSSCGPVPSRLPGRPA